MSTDLNLPAAEDLKMHEADCSIDVDCIDEDYDYEPPMPYDYRQHWAENPVGWALGYASNLFRKFASGPDFYKNIDALTVEAWVFDDYPAVLQTLSDDGTLENFRSSLSRKCRMLKAAATLANEVVSNYQGVFCTVPLNSPEAAECDEFFPGWLTRIWREDKWKWQAELPGVIAELRGRWADEEFGSLHQSDEVVPHSRIARPERVTTTAESRQSITAYLLEREDFSTCVRDATNERLAFFIQVPADVNLEALTKCNRTRLSVHKHDGDGTCVWDLALGAGVLSIPLLDNVAVLNRFRARMPVIYERDGEKWIVEYDWNPVAFGREYIELAQNITPDGDIAVDVPRRPLIELSPEAMRIERICPMSLAEFLGMTRMGNPDDDDLIPF